MDIKELKQRYAAGERDFTGVDLSRLSMQFINLSGADFSNANLYRANLASANLSNTNLSNANLKFINLNGANLSNTNLSNANLERATLLGANLEGANLSYANLKHTYLDGANFKNANLNGVDLTDAELIGANLIGVDLSKTINAVTVANLYQPSEDNPDLELLSSIKESSHGLSFISEGDYAYEVFLWDVNKQDEFTIKKLIQIVGYPDDSYPNHRLGNIEEIPDKEDLKITFAREHELKPDEPLIIDGIEYEIVENPPSPYAKPKLDYSDDYVVECEIYHKYRLFNHFFAFIYCDIGILDNEASLNKYKILLVLSQII